MRVSGLPTDVDYWRNGFVDVPRITLDGEELKHVVEASDHDQFGYVVVEIRGADGKLKTADVVCEGEVLDRVIATRRMRGKVEITGKRR